jgi:hypothetical protein
MRLMEVMKMPQVCEVDNKSVGDILRLRCLCNIVFSTRPLSYCLQQLTLILLMWRIW